MDSTLDLDAIEQRAKNATPGPWRWSGYPFNETKELKGRDHSDDEGFVLRGFADAGGGEWYTDVRPEDAEFIAHAREDVPALLAYARQLEAAARPRGTFSMDKDSTTCAEAEAKRIPIAAAKRIANTYGYDQVVIFTRAHRTDNKEHVTTYGKTVEDCDIAARMGNHLKRVVGWPESKCQDKPARIARSTQPLTLTAADLEAAVTAVMGAKLPYPICGDGCCTGTNLLTFTQARWVLEAALKAIPNIVLPESEEKAK